MSRTVKTLLPACLLLSFLLFQAPAAFGEPIGIAGTFGVGTPWGAPDFLFYGLGGINLSGDSLRIQSNDDKWSANGWPGVVLEKIFFPYGEESGTGGLFTADVEVDLGDGVLFAAVINPDNSFIPNPNTSGIFSGPSSHPTEFGFSELPVYAVVQRGQEIFVDWPERFEPWDYESNLYGTTPGVDVDGNPISIVDFESPLFSLALIGTLTLTAVDPPFSLYGVEGQFTLPGPQTVPDPGSTLLLLGMSLAGLVGVHRRRMRK
jgi:hypothetical protein